MEIRIDSSSDVPIHRQLTEQIVFLIATEKLKGGEFLPSVRELARRLKIHHNTVSRAYQDLVKKKWLEMRRGSRLAVIARGRSPEGVTLDDLINSTIAMARENGFSLQQLRERVRQRLLSEAPDHLLVVEQDDGIRRLICEELGSAMDWPVDGCTREALFATPGLAIGALIVTPSHALRFVQPMVPKDRPAVPLIYSHADEHLKKINALRRPSVIAVVSASPLFVEVARGILAPAIGDRHTVREVLFLEEGHRSSKSADLIFCDSIAIRSLRSPKAFHYPLLSKNSLADVAATMKSYQM